MMNLLWQVEIGQGVIDCSISTSKGLVAAGDVNGTVIVSDYKGNVQEIYNYDLPVWGIDISNEGSIVAVGLASKAPSRGALIVIENGKEKYKKSFGSAVWDVKITSNLSKVFASTWGDGLVYYDITLSEISQIPFSSSLFGLSINNDQEVFITASGEGIYRLDISHHKKLENPTLITRSNLACYKNCFNQEKQKIIYGSSGSLISSLDLSSSQENHYRTLMNSVCGIAFLDDYLFYGDLNGNFCIARTDYPSAPFFHQQFDEAIWNIAIDKSNFLMFIACGDGNLYCYKVDVENIRKTFLWSSKKIVINPSILRGTKIFIAYASEDEETVKVLYNTLSSMNCEPWMDKYNLLPGQNWKYEIRSAIRNSDFFLVCLSHNSVSKRGFLQKEIKEALDILDQVPEGRIFLIPVRLENCNVPEMLVERQWVDIFSDDGVYKLLLAIYLEKLK